MSKNIINREEIKSFFKTITGCEWQPGEGYKIQCSTERVALEAKEKAVSLGYIVSESDIEAFIAGDHLPGLITAIGLTEDPEPKRGKYDREIRTGVFVDVYDVLSAWEVTDPAIQHAIKKCLQPGARGVKSCRQDVEEAIASLKRSLDLPFVGK